MNFLIRSGCILFLTIIIRDSLDTDVCSYPIFKDNHTCKNGVCIKCYWTNYLEPTLMPKKCRCSVHNCTLCNHTKLNFVSNFLLHIYRRYLAISKCITIKETFFWTLVPVFTGKENRILILPGPQIPPSFRNKGLTQRLATYFLCAWPNIQCKNN